MTQRVTKVNSACDKICLGNIESPACQKFGNKQDFILSGLFLPHLLQLLIQLPGSLGVKTMDDKLMYIPNNDKQN